MIAIEPPGRFLIFPLASEGPSTHGTEGDAGRVFLPAIHARQGHRVSQRAADWNHFSAAVR
jgi:hypothetical protein